METSSTTEAGDSTTGSIVPTDPGCPACTVLVDELVGGRGLALDETYVYFTDQSQGTVSRIMKGGGDGGVIVDNQNAPYSITVDATHIYWTNYTGDGEVMRARKDGTESEIIASAPRPRAIAVDETHVYWSTFDSSDGDVYRRVLTQNEPEEVLARMFGGVPSLALGDGRIYWTAHTTDAGSAFISDPNEDLLGGVFSTALDGKIDPFTVETVVTNQAQPWGLTRTASGQLLWANGDGGEPYEPNHIMTWNAGGGATPLFEGSTAPWGIATDSERVYWTDNDRVLALPLDGNDADTLAEQQNSARSIAVDDAHVFWITRNRVLQRPKSAR